MHEYSDIAQQQQPEMESIPLSIERPVGVMSTAVNSTRENWSSALVGALTSTNFNRKRNRKNMETSINQYENPELHDSSNASGKFKEHSVPTFNPEFISSSRSLIVRSRPKLSAKSRSHKTATRMLTTAATRPEHNKIKTVDDQLKLITQNQILNSDPVDYCPALSNVPKTKALQTSTFYHLPGSLRSMDDDSSISNQAKTSRTTRNTSVVVANEPEITFVVIPDVDESTETPTTTTTSTKSWPLFFKPKKKETNLPKTVGIFQARSFFGDTELSRMVGDLRKQMTTKGLCVFDHFLGEEKGKDVLSDVLNLYEKGDFVNGQLESSPNRSSSPSPSQRVVRGDVITWLSGDERGCSHIKNLMERIDAAVMMCGGQLGGYTIKQRTRAMVACYPGNGTHYLRHIDNPCRNGRVITCIYYLNNSWDVCRDGGLLRIYPEGSPEVANVEPIFDRLLFFWSDRRNPHEVKPAHRRRFAITLWYYDEREQAEWQRRRRSKVQTTSSLLNS